ncbi:MAG: hypothetical protein ABI693_09555 [Bryobacteraceae bacterium]
MKAKLVLLALLAAGAAFAEVSIGIVIGAPPRPRVVRVQPRSPGAGYSFVTGYWYPVGRRYKWHQGYWTRPAYEGAQWVAPRYSEGRYYNGYWNGGRGQFAHDHRWDRDRDHHRDFDRDRDHDRR